MGDAIISLNNKPIKGIYKYMERLSELKPRMTISIVIQSSKETVTLTMTL